MNFIKRIFSYLAPVVTIFVPFAIYLSFRNNSLRYLFCGLLALYVIRVVFFLRKGIKLRQVVIFMLTGLFLGFVMIFNRTFLALYTPTLINFGLLLSFGSTLYFGPPVIETFARMQVRTLSEAEVKYCRILTMLWSVFFLFNGSVSCAISSTGNLKYWLIYNGFISYIMIGLFFSIEMTYRYYRFRNYGHTIIDSFYKKIFKPYSVNN
ncbi:MAG: hypothetical protein GX640_22310 [Fibrobacter sp.]|nr:hypothetical protein [Fibrobacter sp.]